MASSSGAEAVQRIGELEVNSHPGPFACISGARSFVKAHTPVASLMVLPADRITPLLNGPLLRSGQMAQTAGIVVSLAWPPLSTSLSRRRPGRTSFNSRPMQNISSGCMKSSSCESRIGSRGQIEPAILCIP